MSSLMDADRRAALLSVLRAALMAVEPGEALRGHVHRDGDWLHVGPQTWRLSALEHIYVVGGGKAGAAMAAELHTLLGDRISAGVVNVKYGHTATTPVWEVRVGSLGAAGAQHPPPEATGAAAGSIALIEAGHPTPDAAGMAGAERIAALLQTAGERDLVIVLLSGGGSALLPLPVADITLDDYRALTGQLLRCGADITQINTVRKHCSRLQGGQMARLAAPAPLVALILSDVVGSPLDVIASGPAVPDPSTYHDALALLRAYGLLDQAPASVVRYLRRGEAGEMAETPKPGDPLFARATNVVIGDNASAARAATEEARRRGLHAALLTTFCQGEAREVGKMVAGLAQGIAAGQSDFAPPVCVVMGGETTVTVRGKGQGGRNQELALAAAVALDSAAGPAGAEVVVVSLATDGTDGPTEAAGGLATTGSVARGRALGLDAAAALADNASLPYLNALGDLIITGPTGTNVNDLIFAFAW